MGSAIFVLGFVAAIGSGLVAGTFFAFSSFVMAALGRLPSDHGMAAMNAINVTVINPAFMLAFFGTAVVCLMLSAASFLWWAGPAATLVPVASAIYLVGCIGVTMAFNVPLNNALAGAPPGTPKAAALWSRYLADWTAWNTVRTVASALSAILFTLALLL